jgi:ubiquinol-cytochrome c reductase iron-sulfur subunit
MDSVDHGRRRFLTLATTVVGGAGVVRWPYLYLLHESQPTRAGRRCPVEADVSKLEPVRCSRSLGG